MLDEAVHNKDANFRRGQAFCMRLQQISHLRQVLLPKNVNKKEFADFLNFLDRIQINLTFWDMSSHHGLPPFSISDLIPDGLDSLSGF